LGGCGREGVVDMGVRCGRWGGAVCAALMVAVGGGRGVEGACSAIAKRSTVSDIRDKLKPDRPSGGSSYWPGGAGTGLHIYVDPRENSEYTEDSHMFTKVSIHEYIHILQQAFIQGDVTGVTGPVPLRDDATSQTRFHVINACEADERFEQVHIDALEGMDDDMKLLDVPTYVILYPIDDENGDYGCTSMTDTQLDARAEEIFNTIYGEDCAGMWKESDVLGDFGARDGGPMAEGSAEYYALVEGTSAWTVFDGDAYWTIKLRDDYEYCEPVGNENLGLITTGNEDNIAEVIDANRDDGLEHCWDNPIGELVFEAFLKYCEAEQFSCTHKDLKETYIAASTSNWYSAFEAQYGVSWGTFICAARVMWELEDAANCDAAAIDQEALAYAVRKWGADATPGDATTPAATPEGGTTSPPDPEDILPESTSDTSSASLYGASTSLIGCLTVTTTLVAAAAAAF